jgi:hypothetical protein
LDSLRFGNPRQPRSSVNLRSGDTRIPSRDPNRRSVARGLKPTPKAPDACCLWCGRAFIPRTTGGSAQKFCCTGHRQQFWIAARCWTMRAIEAGLLSVTLGRLLKGVSHERARCPRGISRLKISPRTDRGRMFGLNAKNCARRGSRHQSCSCKRIIYCDRLPITTRQAPADGPRCIISGRR